MAKHIVKIDEKYVVFKQYDDGERFYAHPMESYETLREAYKAIEEEFASAVPANCMGGGAIAGDDIGYSKKRGYKFLSIPKLMRRKKPKK